MKSQLIICMVLILTMLTSSAYAGCGRWVIRDNTDFLKDPIFDEAVASSTGSSATVNADGTPKAKNDTSENEATENVAIQKKSPAVDLAGKWKVLLEKSPEKKDSGKTIDLILIQNGERLQGYGTLLEEASDTPATATGSISGEGISLDVKLVQQKKDYKLDMALVKGNLQGIYELYEMEALAENGNVTASRSKS